MATRIRLSKVGRKKQPSFRIVVAGGMHARGGRTTETIGKYNPRTNPSYIEVDERRAIHWLREGAEMSESVSSLFRKAGILKKYAEGEDGEGVVVIGDPQGKTRLAERPGGKKPEAAKAEEPEPAKTEAEAPEAKAPEAKAAEPEAAVPEAAPEAEAAEPQAEAAEEEQDAEK
jgi:small subunit ribosomal protein S16